MEIPVPDVGLQIQTDKLWVSSGPTETFLYHTCTAKGTHAVHVLALCERYRVDLYPQNSLHSYTARVPVVLRL